MSRNSFDSFSIWNHDMNSHTKLCRNANVTKVHFEPFDLTVYVQNGMTLA